ncbi:MAG: membrane protein [Patescibacteria group bacterium]|nr:MAG: membrane protein [Patescibacteria group bacterium]
MDLISFFISFILHIDKHLGEIISQYGTFAYLILFLIIFVETGLVFTPFLPGDSLLFAAGAFAAIGSFDIFLLFFLLWGAAVLGDTVNYWIGHFFGEKIISNKRIPIKQEHVEKTQVFYAKHGGKTIFLARFVPIVRTFAPFVAGVGKMRYGYFIAYNIFGGFVWVASFLSAGYFFGNIPQVKENFSLVIFTIIFISILPMIVEGVKSKRSKKQES